MCMCEYMHVQMEIRSQGWVSSFLIVHLSFVSLSLNLELTDLARLAGQ